MPDTTRTTAPASLISIIGATASACGTVSTGTGSAIIGIKPGAADPAVFVDRAGTSRHAAPAEHLLRTNLPATSNLSDPRSRFQCLRDNPRLLVRGPTAATTRSRQDLNTPKDALRVVANVKHKDSSKLVASAKETTSGEGIKQGHRSPAYDWWRVRIFPSAA